MNVLLLALGLALAAPTRAPATGGDDDTPADHKARTPAQRPGMRIAAAAMQGGSTRSAIRIYKKQVEANPEAPAPHVALGRAYAKAGRCKAALDELWPWIGTTPFGLRAALAGATCSARLGLYADAVWFDRLALEAQPGNLSALTVFALDLHAVGDPVSAGEVIELLATGLASGRDRSLFVEASLAARRGDVDAFDAIAAQWEREGRPPQEMKRLSAQLWLDLDDPTATLHDLGPASRSPALRPLRAEALRRGGEPEEALRIIDLRIKGHAEGMQADAVRARIHVDLGELEDAAALLDAWEGADDPDLLASAWYLARARGEADATAALAAAYAEVQESPLRKLDLLVPIAARTP